MTHAGYLTDLSWDEILDLTERFGGRPFQGRMLFKWLFNRGARSFEEMTDLPKRLREAMAGTYRVQRLRERERRSSRDGTEKILFELPDGHTIETVKIPETDRLTLCISTQVGCAMACRFCASGLQGLERNLTSGEIVEQVVLSAVGEQRSVTNLVVMGIGEPLTNIENLTLALRTINRTEGPGLGARRITVSTVGIPEGIRKLADLGLQIKLAVSLHAADEEKRRALMPAAGRFPLSDVLQAADYFRFKTTRDVTYEVLLLGGVNDTREDGAALVSLLKGRKAYVNLIPYNRVDCLEYSPPTPERVQAFRSLLEKARIPVSVRKPRGEDIEAACGQLRLKNIEGAD